VIASGTLPRESKRVRISKKVSVAGSIGDVWRVMGNFVDLAWTGVESTMALSGDEVTALALTGLGGVGGTEMVDALRGTNTNTSTNVNMPNVVGLVREFRHPGSTRPIRHRCLAVLEPTAALLSSTLSDPPSDTACCGYVYELLVETAVLARVPVQAYASELRVRPSSSGTGVTVEWSATLVVRDERLIQGVSEEYEKSLELLVQKMAAAHRE